MLCREACGACCIAPSINRPFFGMPEGKPAGVPCVHLTAAKRCALFGDPRRPRLCHDFAPEPAVCGVDAGQAMRRLQSLEVLSAPDGGQTW
jgi:hypothetical protein